MLNVISAYAAQVGLDTSIKRQLWEDLEGLVRSVPTNEKLFIGGDLNGHVGTTNLGFEVVHGIFGFGNRNQEGKDILDFDVAYDLLVANTLFGKRLSHLVTFRSAKHSSQIDFVLTRRIERRACLDCKVIPGECVMVQHKLVVADFLLHACVLQDKGVQITRTKWWKLKGEDQQTFKERLIAEGPWSEDGDVDS